MENICSKDYTNDGDNFCQWTNQSHSNFLSLMEESFVKTMFTKNYVDCKSNNKKTGNNTRLDRFVPDMAESTLDLGSRKSVTKAAIRVLGAVTTTRPTQRQRLRRFHPYKITHDQVVPELEAKAGDKAVRFLSISSKEMERSSARRSCGGICKPVPNDGFWIDAQRIVNEMAENSYRDKMDSPPVGPVPILKLSVQPVAGVLYFITFRAIGENGLSTDYTTEVWRKPGDMGIEISSFAKVKGSGFKTGSSKISDNGNSSKEKEGLDHFKGVSAPVQMSNTDAMQGSESSKLRIHGFHILLEQIRRQRPSLKYAMAKKCASTKWKKLSENEKMVFMAEAARRLNKD